MVKLQYLQMLGLKYQTNISNLHPLEVVGRGSDAQLQVGENLNSSISLFNSWMLGKDVNQIK